LYPTFAVKSNSIYVGNSYVTGEKCIGSLVGEPEVKMPLERPRRIHEANIKVNLKEIGCKNLHYVHLVEVRNTWGAVMKNVMNFQVP
jgi:hypothetical protein